MAVIVTALVVFCTAVTRPVLLTVTCAVSELSHEERPVTSFVVPSLLVAVALSCRVVPAVRVFVDGLTATLDTVGLTKKPLHAGATPNAKSAVTSKTFRAVSGMQKPLKTKDQYDSYDQLTKL